MLRLIKPSAKSEFSKRVNDILIADPALAKVYWLAITQVKPDTSRVLEG